MINVDLFMFLWDWKAVGRSRTETSQLTRQVQNVQVKTAPDETKEDSSDWGNCTLLETVQRGAQHLHKAGE